jgi:hypothetical protein
MTSTLPTWLWTVAVVALGRSLSLLARSSAPAFALRDLAGWVI